MTQIRFNFYNVAKVLSPEESKLRARRAKIRRDLGTGWMNQKELDKYYLDNFGIDRAANRAKTLRKIQEKSHGIDMFDKLEGE